MARNQAREQSLGAASAQAKQSPATRSTVQLDPDLVSEVDEQADREGTNRAALTRKALRFYLDSVQGRDTRLQVVSIHTAPSDGVRTKRATTTRQVAGL